MTEVNKELLAYLVQPPRLPTAYAVISWLDADRPNEKAPAEARQLLSSAANLATALRIRDAIAAIETQTFETFWVTVETMLKQLLLAVPARSIARSSKGWQGIVVIWQVVCEIHPPLALCRIRSAACRSARFRGDETRLTGQPPFATPHGAAQRTAPCTVCVRSPSPA